MNKVLLLATISFVFSNLLYGQEGTIRGKIIDAETGKFLIGATVVITGTTNGTITDFDGNYSLNNLEPGTYDITVSYVSYETQQFPEVVVNAGDVTILDVNLGQATTELSEVQVVTRSRQKTEVALQILQRKSATLLDGISAEQISRLGDSDAASALKRVTGVSVQDGKYVYVRGLSDRYMKVTLNNGEIPGLDPNFNTVQMDLFPSNIIEAMTVSKTYSPDKPSYTSGLVNIKTKDFPSQFSLSASAKIEINSNTHFHNNYIEYEGGSTDWLGYDDGTRSLQEQLTNAEIQDPTNEEVPETNELSRAFNKILSPASKKAPINSSYSLSLGNQINLGNTSSLGYIGALSYKSARKYYDDGRVDLYSASNENTASPDELLAERKGQNNVIWNALAGLHLKVNSNHKIGYTFIHTQNGESTSRIMNGNTYYSDDYIMEKYSLEYLERSLNANQFNGTHVLPRLNNTKIEWLTSHTKSIQNTPDMRFFINEVVPGDEDTTYFVRSNRKPERRYRDMNETNWDTKVDITIPISPNAKLKVGASYLEKIRNSDENRFTINQRSSISDYNGDPSNYVRNTNFISLVYNENQGRYQQVGIFYSNDFFENTRLSYYGKDIITCGYLMGDFTLFNKLRIVAGVRVEKASMFIENKVDTTDEDLRASQREMYSSGSSEDLDYLPAITLKYELIQNMNIRFGYSKSLTRPSFRERAPYTFYEPTEARNIQGNPELKRGLIDNYDFKWEYFFNPGEMVSLSAFYKKIHSPIERYEKQDNTKLTKFRNGLGSKVYGLEFEFRKNLAFIPVLEDFNVGTNLSYIISSTPVDSARLAQARQVVPDFPDTRPLYGQSPYIVNFFVNYNNQNIGLYSNLAFNVQGPKIVIISKRFTPDVYEQPFPQLNFNIGKTLYNKFTLEIAVDNILNPKFEQNITMSDGSTYPYSKYSLSRSYSLSISYKL